MKNYMYALLCGLSAMVPCNTKAAAHASRAQTHPIPSIWNRAAGNLKQKQDFFLSDSQSIFAQSANGVIPPHIKNDVSVRCATFNVHFWNTIDRRKNFQGIKNVIETINADILVLQEVSMFNQDYINKALYDLGYEYQSFIEVARHFSNEPFGNMLLSKYPFVKPPTTKIFDADMRDPREKRGFINVVIQLPNGQQLSVYGTHLDVKSEDRRVQELRELIALTKKDTTKNICIVGDFNAVRKKDYAYANSAEKQVWELLQSDDNRRGEATGTDAMAILERNSFDDCFSRLRVPGPKTTSWPGKVVDFIQLNGSWNLPLKGCYVYYTDQSDHYPVIMDLSVTPQPAARATQAPRPRVPGASQPASSWMSWLHKGAMVGTAVGSLACLWNNSKMPALFLAGVSALLYWKKS